MGIQQNRQTLGTTKFRLARTLSIIGKLADIPGYAVTALDGGSVARTLCCVTVAVSGLYSLDGPVNTYTNHAGC
jgi:hypothetical protein